MKLVSAIGLMLLSAGLALAEVRVEEVPEKGLQPEVMVGADGVVHLVYLAGEPQAATVRYTRREPGKPWQAARDVSSKTSAGIAVGSIRGAQLALGAEGRVHVLWNGNSATASGSAPLWHARLSADQAAFEAPVNLLGSTTALDGGASIAADPKSGKVVVAWHGNSGGGEPEEKQRLVFVRTSMDAGGTFADPDKINATAPGVCACCSLKVSLDPEGSPRVFFRNAAAPNHRAMTLLASGKDGWISSEIENWMVAACPMSSCSMVFVRDRLVGAWETSGKVRMGFLPDALESAFTVANKNAKHPVLAVNASGRILAAWVEGTGWNRGGTAAWVELDSALKPAGPIGRAEGVPIWGRVAAYAEPDGTFVVLR